MKRILTLLIVLAMSTSAYTQNNGEVTQKLTKEKIGNTIVTGVAEDGDEDKEGAEGVDAKSYPAHYKGKYQLPAFREGWNFQRYRKWVVANVVYPSDCLRERIEGKVIVAFIIDKDGVVRNAEVLESPDPRLSEALVSVVKSGKWFAAAQHWDSKAEAYESVGMRSLIPIEFHLPAEDPTAAKSLTYGMMNGDFSNQ